MRITVFCSSRDANPTYNAAARELGAFIGSRGHELVYGGIGVGNMLRVASGCKDNGGRVTGVVPIVKRPMAWEGNDENLAASNLLERKSKMITLGDVFVALPGGYGTLDELLSTYAELAFSGDRSKRIVVVNIDGLFDPTMEQLTAMQREGLLDNGETGERMLIVDSAKAAIEALQALGF